MTSVIELDNPGPYSLGQKVTGHVFCTVNSIQNIEDMKCSLVGLEKTKIVVLSEGNSIDYVGYNEIFKDEITLVEGKVEPGSYKFPFSFKLPDSLIPSSFTYEFGKICYNIETAVKRDGQLCKNYQELEVPIFWNFNDLSTDVTLAPITYPIEETINSCCCLFGKSYLFMELTLEKDTFFVGENIFIKLVVDNRSNVKNTCLEIVLLSHTEFTAEIPSRRSHIVIEELSKINGGIIIPKTYNFDLEIPKHVKIPLLTGRLIKQRHTLTVRTIPDICEADVKFSVDLKLGHKEGKGPASIGWSASGASTSTNSKYADSKDPQNLRSSYATPSAPIVNNEEIERLLARNGNNEQLFLPPTYDEAIRNK